MQEKITKFIYSLREQQNLRNMNEEAVKQGIVLKILNYLDWDVFNTEEIYPEYSIEGGRADYSLRILNENKIFIEAKNSNVDLENSTYKEQLLNYSFKQGVKLAILTNGLAWWFYLPLNEGSWDKRKFYSIDLIAQEPNEISSKFIDFLSKQNVYSGKAVENAEQIYKSKQKERIINETLPNAWESLITEPDELLIDLVADKTEKICGYKPSVELVKEFLNKEVGFEQKDDIEIKKTSVIVKEKIRNSHSSREDVFGSTRGKYWYIYKKSDKVFRNSSKDIYAEIIDKFCKEEQNFVHKFGGLFSPRGNRRYIAKNKKDLYIGRPDLADISKQLSNGWYIGTNYSKQSILKNLEVACKTIGVRFGNDLKVYLGK